MRTEQQAARKRQTSFYIIAENGDKVKSFAVEAKYKNTKRIIVMMRNAMRKSILVAFFTTVLIYGFALAGTLRFDRGAS